MKPLIGIDIGGTAIKGLAITPEGRILAEAVVDTSDDRTAAFAGRVEALAEELEGQSGRADCIGIAAPGLAAPDGRSIAWMEGRLDGLMHLDWPARLKRPALVLNDGHAALAGEHRFGAAKGCRNVVMLTLGTGVGGAVIAEGCLLKGAMGRAGHLGHISLDPYGLPDIVRTPGSLELAIGECTLHARTNGQFSSTRDLLAQAAKGGMFARWVWDNSVRSLAAGIASLINCFDPERVVIGGGVAEAGEMLFQPLEHYMELFEWRPSQRRVEIRKAELGTHAGAMGAAAVAGEPL